MASSLALLGDYGSEEEEEEEDDDQGPQASPKVAASALSLMLPPPSRSLARPGPAPAPAPALPAAKRTVGVGLANLLRSAELPNASNRASVAAIVHTPEEADGLPPGFFDEGALDGDADDAEQGGVGAGSRKAGGLSSLLSMLPPPSRGRGPAAASVAPAAGPPVCVPLPHAAAAAVAPSGPTTSLSFLPALARVPTGGEQSEEEEEAEAEEGGEGLQPFPQAAAAIGVGGQYGPKRAGGPGEMAAGAIGGSEDEDEGSVTAPYPGGDEDEEGDDGVTAPYPGGDDDGASGSYANAGAWHAGGWQGGGEPQAAWGGGGRSAHGQQSARQQPAQLAHMDVPAELLSKAERRALADAQSAGCAMSAVDQGELRRTYRAATEVVVPRPAADISVEGRVFNRQTGAAEVTSKPTGGQKRKHQINQLAHQYLQQAPELEQRGRKGLKSKAETYGRYGW